MPFSFAFTPVGFVSVPDEKTRTRVAVHVKSAAEVSRREQEEGPAEAIQHSRPRGRHVEMSTHAWRTLWDLVGWVVVGWRGVGVDPGCTQEPEACSPLEGRRDQLAEAHSRIRPEEASCVGGGGMGHSEEWQTMTGGQDGCTGTRREAQSHRPHACSETQNHLLRRHHPLVLIACG